MTAARVAPACRAALVVAHSRVTALAAAHSRVAAHADFLPALELCYQPQPLLLDLPWGLAEDSVFESRL